MDGFWVPVAGEEDVYVHFGNDITDLVRPELLPSVAQ
jgi:cold shock CspA family protein